MEETNRPGEVAESPEQTGRAGQIEEDTETRTPESSKDARNMAMLCHLLGIVGFFAPLVIWLIEREKHRFVDEHGRAAMNYQISIIVYFAMIRALYYVFGWTDPDLLFLLVYLSIALFVLHMLLVVAGAIRASQGRRWRYPIAITFLK